MESKTFFILLNNCLDIDDNDIITQRFLFLIQTLLENNHKIILVSYKNIDYKSNIELEKYINSNQLIIEYTDGLKIVLKEHTLTFQNIFSFNLLKIIKKYIQVIDLFVLDDIPYRNYLVNYISLFNKSCLINSLIDLNSYISFYQYNFLKKIIKNHYNFMSKNIINTSTSESYLKSINTTNKYITWPKLILKNKLDLNIDKQTISIEQRNKWKNDLGDEYQKFLLCITELNKESCLDKIINILPNDIVLIIIVTNSENKYEQRIKCLIEAKSNILIYYIKNLTDQKLAEIYLSCDFTISANSMVLDDIYILLGYFYNIPCITQCNNFSFDLITNNNNGIFINFNQEDQVQIERLNFAFTRKKRFRGISKIFEDYSESSLDFYQKFNDQILNDCIYSKNDHSYSEWIQLIYNYLIYIFSIYLWSFNILLINKFSKYQIYQINFDSDSSKKFKITNYYKANIYYIYLISFLFYLLIKNFLF